MKNEKENILPQESPKNNEFSTLEWLKKAPLIAQKFSDFLKQLKSNNAATYRFFRVMEEQGVWLIHPKRSELLKALLGSVAPFCSPQDLLILSEVELPRKIKNENLSPLFDILHEDLSLALNWLRQATFSDHPEIMKCLAIYLGAETGKGSQVSTYTKSKKNHSFISGAFEVLEKSIYFKKDGSVLKNDEKLSKKNKTLLFTLPYMRELELHPDFDEKKLLKIVSWAHKGFENIKKFENQEGLKIIKSRSSYSLRIRKIKRLKKKGLFIPLTNTIVVDPRYMESFAHEIGHWIEKNCSKKAFQKIKTMAIKDSFPLRNKEELEKIYDNDDVEKEQLADWIAKYFFNPLTL